MFEFTDITLTHHLNNSVVIKNLGELAAQIAYYNFKWRFITLVIFRTMDTTACVEAFLSSYNKPIVLKKGEFIPSNRVHVTQFVIFGRDSNELANILTWLSKSRYDVSGRMIIVCGNADHNRCQQDEVFKTISSLFMVNSIFLMPTENTVQPTVLTYYPMKPNNCTNHSPENMNIDLRCSNQSCRTAFPEKLDNFFGCALYISTIHQPPYMYLYNEYDEPYGADGDIIKLVANILNATLKMKLPIKNSEWGRYINNNWTGSLGDVFNKRVHASMASIPLTPSTNGNFQISFSYYSMEMVWTTRLPDLKPAWEKLFHPLEMNTRLMLFVTFIMIIIIEFCMRTRKWNRIRRLLNISRSKSNLLFKSWILFLGMSVSKMPSKPALMMIVFCWIWFSFVIRCAYQGILFNSLKTTYYEDYFDDIQESSTRGYSYGGTQPLREYYLDEHDIYEKWRVVRSVNVLGLLDKLSSGKADFVLALNKAAILQYLMNSNGTKPLQIIPKHIVISPTVMYFKKFSPHPPAINRVLKVLVEGGFIDLIYARYLDQATYLFEHPQVYGPMPLGFGHFAACFMLLVAGWFVSAVYFVVEIYCKPPRVQ